MSSFSPARDPNFIRTLSAPIASLLGLSAVLHGDTDAAACSTLSDVLAVLPFSGAEAERYVSPVAATDDVSQPPPFTLASGNCSSLLFLAPMYPHLRALSIRDAARAWVLLDMLCLDATRRIEDDLVQRYAEDPSAEADWRGVLTVPGCPACDTLWELVTKKYATLRERWEYSAPAPTTFGTTPSEVQVAGRAEWQRGINMGLLTALKSGRTIHADGRILGPRDPLCAAPPR